MLASLHAIFSVATKEFLHIIRDRRIVILLLILPPFFTLLFGHAFEAGAIKGVPATLQDRDQSAESESLLKELRVNETFAWSELPAEPAVEPDLLRMRTQALLVVPPDWGRSLREGKPLPIQLVLDGSDTNTAYNTRGAVHEAIGEFQLAAREKILGSLPV
ncbi:MAG: hypothetical protein EOP84_36725, partial [Verrucomicrobiaceae bacterium]